MHAFSQPSMLMCVFIWRCMWAHLACIMHAFACIILVSFVSIMHAYECICMQVHVMWMHAFASHALTFASHMCITWNLCMSSVAIFKYNSYLLKIIFPLHELGKGHSMMCKHASVCLSIHPWFPSYIWESNFSILFKLDNYRQISIISRTLLGNNFVVHQK